MNLLWHQSHPCAAPTAASCQRHFAAAAEEVGGALFSTLGSGGGEPSGGGWGLFLMLPEHQDPIRTRERLKGDRAAAECAREEVGECKSARVHGFICGCCGESCDPRGRSRPPVSAEVCTNVVKATQQRTTVLMHGEVKGRRPQIASHPIGA